MFPCNEFLEATALLGEGLDCPHLPRSLSKARRQEKERQRQAGGKWGKGIGQNHGKHQENGGRGLGKTMGNTRKRLYMWEFPCFFFDIYVCYCMFMLLYWTVKSILHRKIGCSSQK